MVQEPYKLDLPRKDGGQPYGVAGTGAVGSHQGVRLIRHHVVPNARLKDLWFATLTCAEGDLSATKTFMTDLTIHAAYYESMLKQNNGSIHQSDMDAVVAFTARISAGEIVHEESAKFPDCIDTYWQIHCWPPGNLFVGPDGRIDDPGKKFDTRARRVVGGTRFALLEGLDTAISAFLKASNDVTKARAAWDSLANITALYEPVAFRTCDWEWPTGAKGPSIVS